MCRFSGGYCNLPWHALFCYKQLTCTATLVLYYWLVLDVEKKVDMASGLIICLIRPIFMDRTDVGSKHSSVKCSLHRAECSLEPLHLSLVLCTCNVQALLSLLSTETP